MSQRKVAIVYGRVDSSADADEQDVLVQVKTVRAALEELGHESFDVPLTLDLGAAAAVLKAAEPLIAFNLAETIDGKGSLIHLAPSLLDSLGIPYTGAPCEAILLTSHKLLAKKSLAAGGIPTPAWAGAKEALEGETDFGTPWIVKQVWEHASIGMEDSAVVRSREELAAELRRRSPRESSGSLFVERYIDGREFNCALLGGADRAEPECLPPAEIRFIGYPEGKPRVVGYRAKWVEDSFEYDSTPRRFEFPPEDAQLLAEMRRLCLLCWRHFGLRGYARVDFRIDGEGKPWVLEINTNPCLSPDAGFMAAAEQRGLSIVDVVRRIVSEAEGKVARSDRECHA
ncbi:MAG: D-alanine--D-alanine ligase [Spirochaetia bacterium]|jgi:D-alanine-D-alanine ligase